MADLQLSTEAGAKVRALVSTSSLRCGTAMVALRRVRIIAALCLVAAILVVAERRLTPPLADGRLRKCEIPRENARPLDLTGWRDRAHLRDDAATAEGWALAYADVRPERQQGPAAYRAVMEHCLADVFKQVAEVHSVDVQTVRASAAIRDPMFDAGVFIALAISFGFLASPLVAVAVARFQDDGLRATLIALVTTSVFVTLIGWFAGEMLTTGAEILRVGNGHLSYRTGRIPWQQNRALVSSLFLVIFWTVATVRLRRGAPEVHAADGT